MHAPRACAAVSFSSIDAVQQLWPYLAGALVAGSAVAASLHAIFTKRNVGTAVAWVGLIWLSPLVGAILYLFLGINRIHRRASALRGQSERYLHSAALPRTTVDELIHHIGPRYEHLTAIARLGERITVRPLLVGNRVDALYDGDEAYPAMLEAIGEARESVTLATYIFDNDRAGRAFRDALAAAVARGVKVRVLIDAVGARYSFPSMVHALRRAGIPVARFMPAALHWRMPYFNLRNHRKILVVDGRIGFTGGINIREGHWLTLNPGHPVRDLHFRVGGPVVAELQEVFAEDWTFTTGERLAGHGWFPDLESAGSTVARGISDGPDVDFDKLPSILMGALGAARSSVRIVTPYFIPDPNLITALTLAALRGVSVQILLPGENNLALVQWASTAYWGQLLDKGCRIYLSPPPFDHSKLMVVDGVWTLLGSANWDPRSLMLNFEFNLECYDPVFGKRMDRWLRERIAQAREVTLDDVQRRPAPVRLRDGLARLLSPYL
jgi:cardiolipin synthase A/B